MSFSFKINDFLYYTSSGLSGFHLVPSFSSQVFGLLLSLFAPASRLTLTSTIIVLYDVIYRSIYIHIYTQVKQEQNDF